MSVYKRGNVYWYKFIFEGEKIQKSTRQGSQRKARQIEAAHKTRLAMGEAGFEEKRTAPMFRDLAERFVANAEAHLDNKPQTVKFYIAKLARLLEYSPIAGLRADRIDEGVIEGYVVARRATVAPATVNRELATLRRILRLAHEWREIQRVPRFRLLPGERVRDFVLSKKQEEAYLAICPQPLHDIAVIMLETGMRIGEALNLEWQDVTLDPIQDARFGFLRVREGKSKNARRSIPLTDRATSVLRGRQDVRETPYVFASREARPYLVTSMNHRHRSVCSPKAEGKRRDLFPADFVLHSLRHTMLTRLGESGVDAFAIMRIAGHSSITVSQRYIHPTPEAVERAFERFQRSGDFAVNERARLRGATVSATLSGSALVSH